jgi:DNA-binding transcriptional MerR regulator
MTQEVKVSDQPGGDPDVVSAAVGVGALDVSAADAHSDRERSERPVVALHQIGEVAQRVGVSLRTVRYYEEQGLLVPESRSAGGFRLYSDDQIDRLWLIKQMKPLGFTIEETRTLLEARDALDDPDAPSSDHELATARLREFAAAASDRCEQLSLALDRASNLARRLRREARAGAAAPGSAGRPR